MSPKPANPTHRALHLSTSTIAVVSLSLGLLNGCTVVRADSRISGTYVASDNGSAAMLQLTQTDNGQITGLLTAASLNANGQLELVKRPVTGTVDSGQISLSTQGAIFGLDSVTMAGTVGWSGITMQIVDANVHVESFRFTRASAERFQEFADELKVKGKAIVLNANLTKLVQASDDVLQRAASWAASTNLHAQRLPGVEDRYRQIEDRMQALINKERATPNAVARGQISVTVSQGDVMAAQLDNEVSGVWREVVDGGASLNNAMDSLAGTCAPENGSKLRNNGASGPSIDRWQSACARLSAGRQSFEPVFRMAREKSVEISGFQHEAERRRQSLVKQANSLE